VRGHVARKGDRYYAVIYEGINPATGKERHRWYAAGTRRSDAEKLVNDLVRKKQEGEVSSPERMTLSTYLTDRWLPIQESRLAATTYASYRNQIDLHIVPNLGRKRLDKLQPDDLELLYAALLRRGRKNGKVGTGLSPASVRYVHRILRKALGRRPPEGDLGPQHRRHR
jgi:integrase